MFLVKCEQCDVTFVLIDKVDAAHTVAVHENKQHRVTVVERERPETDAEGPYTEEVTTGGATVDTTAEGVVGSPLT